MTQANEENLQQQPRKQAAKCKHVKSRQALSPLTTNDKVDLDINNDEEERCDCVEWQRLEALLPPDHDRGAYFSEVHTNVKILPQLVCLPNVYIVILSNAVQCN